MSLELDRRKFLLVLGAAVLFRPNLAWAEEWVYSASLPWSSRYWFPIGADAASSRGIPRLHETGGTLDAYDKLYQAKNGTNPHFRELAENYVNRTINYYPDTLSFAGGCGGLAAANILEPEPPQESAVVAGVNITYPVRVGLLTALHEIDDLHRSASVEALMADSLATGNSFVVSAIENGNETWNMAVLAISSDGQNVLVTNFGKDPKPLSVFRIADAYRPYPRSQRGLNGIDPAQLELFSEWQMQIGGGFELDEELVRAVVYRGVII